jgi:hypothetical protein
VVARAIRVSAPACCLSDPFLPGTPSPLLIDRIRKFITGRRGITLAAIAGSIRSSGWLCQGLSSRSASRAAVWFSGGLIV